MTQERRLIHRSTPPIQAEPFAADTSASRTSPLVEQAAAFGQVARESLDDCRRGDEAEQELLRRRNPAGQ